MQLQNPHERAASTHEKYDLLHSDPKNRVLFEGIGHTLHYYANATKKFADSLMTGKTYQHPVSLDWLVEALNQKVQITIKRPDQRIW